MKYLAILLLSCAVASAQIVELTPPKPSGYAGTGIAVALNPSNSGQWQTLADASQSWSLTIKAAKAKGLLAMFSALGLPEGSRLEIINATGRIITVFDHQKNNQKGVESPPIWGHSITIRYFGPANAQPVIELSDVIYFHHLPQSDELSGARLGYGNADRHCTVNINCGEGLNWQREKRSTVLIVVFIRSHGNIGAGFCSGTLLNTTAKDHRPVVISAGYCFDENFILDRAQFHFNFELPGCGYEDSLPVEQYVTGCKLLMRNFNTQTALVEISQPIPTSFSPYFAGWSLDTAIWGNNSYLISNVSGDVKKIVKATKTDYIRKTVLLNLAPHGQHFNSGSLYLTTDAANPLGGNASGGALFSGKERNLRGVLIAGNHSDCHHPDLYVFSTPLWKSWDGTAANVRLRDWLDPKATGQTRLAGKDSKANISIAFSEPECSMLTVSAQHPGYSVFWDLYRNKQRIASGVWDEGEQIASFCVDSLSCYEFKCFDGDNNPIDFAYQIKGDFEIANHSGSFCLMNPPQNPIGFRAEALSAQSVRLNWHHQPDEHAYRITRYIPGQPDQIFVLAADSIGFVDVVSKNLGLSYTLEAIRYTRSGETLYSEPLKADIVLSLENRLTGFSLYPNPTSQNLNFSYEGAAEVRVFDILGVQVASFSLRNEYKLDISGFAKGIYLIEVTAKEGKAVRRVVVE